MTAPPDRLLKIDVMYHRATPILLLSLLLTIAPGPGEAEETSLSSAKRTPRMVTYLEGLAPPGWRIKGDIEHYTPATLYERINGRSELYMAYAVTAMACVTLVPDTADGTIEIFLYDMKTPLSAFGVFSMERSSEAAEVRLGRQAYHEDGNLFFWKGSFYVTVRGSKPGDLPPQELLAMAEQLDARLTDPGTSLWGNQVLPDEGLVAGSMQYFMSDALALDFMTDTFMAVYTQPAGEITVFLSRRSTPEAAQAVRDQFAEYLEAYGTATERTSVDGTEIASADMGGGRFDAVFPCGRYVAGVTQVRGRAQALAAAIAFRDQLRSRIPPSTP